MRPVVITKSTTGATAPVPLDYYTAASKASIEVLVTGTVNYTVQDTFDDVFADGYDPSTGNWTSSNDGSLVGATTTQKATYIGEPRAIRVLVNSGTGSIRFTVIQQAIST